MLHRRNPMTLLLTGIVFVYSISAAMASTSDEVHAAKIREALHSVVQAAKEFQSKTGTEAQSLQDLYAAKLLGPQDKYQKFMVNDLWQVWGDKTGSLIMWDENVSPDVCKLFNTGNKLPTDASGMPVKNQGLQCVTYLNEFRVLEPVYIHGE